MLAGVVAAWVVGPVTTREDGGGPRGEGGGELLSQIIPRSLVVVKVIVPLRGCNSVRDTVGALVPRIGVVPEVGIGISGRVVSPRVETLGVRVRVPLYVAFALSPTV